MAKKGWLAGFVVARELQRFWEREAIADWGWCKPVLAVVDYAAARTEPIHGWLSELVHHRAWGEPDHPRLRLLLLERHGDPAAVWWRTAFGDGGPIADPGQRRALFAEAYRLARGGDPPSFATDLDPLLVVNARQMSPA